MAQQPPGGARDAVGDDVIRRPRAGLLGSIAGVAILLIAFLPMLKVIADPLVGFLSLGLILANRGVILGIVGARELLDLAVEAEGSVSEIAGPLLSMVN